MSLFAFLLTLSLLGGISSPQTCGCRTVAPDQEPLGGNDDGIIETVKSPVESIRGSVLFSASEKPVDKAIVEVFDYPVNEDSYLRATARKRIVACMTRKHGRFCFTGLSPGRYLLRVGVSNHELNVFNYSFVVVTVGAKGKVSNKKINIELTMAT